MKTIGRWTTIVSLLFTASSSFAQQVDEKCTKDWNDLVVVELMGERCQWLDASKTQAVTNALDRKSACFSQGFKPEQVKHHQAVRQETRTKLKAQFANMDCGPQARGFFDKQFVELTSAR